MAVEDAALAFCLAWQNDAAVTAIPWNTPSEESGSNCKRAQSVTGQRKYEEGL
jgi:hypothetical protein